MKIIRIANYAHKAIPTAQFVVPVDGIGQPVSSLLKQSSLISEPKLYDILNTRGVVADRNHINSIPKMKAYSRTEQLGDAVEGVVDVVIMTAGVPRKPRMIRNDLFNTNVSIVRPQRISEVRFYSTEPTAKSEVDNNKINSLDNIKEILKEAADRYPNDMSYQTGLEAAKSILMPEITTRDKDLNALKVAYLPLYAVVKCRQAIENWENVFGVQYPYDNRKPDKKSSIVKAYNFHYEKWVLIWNNCQDARWLEIKEEIQSKNITEVEACSSIASMLSLAGHDLHFPSVIGEITSEDIIKTLKTLIGVDELSLSCMRPILRVHESFRKS